MSYFGKVKLIAEDVYKSLGSGFSEDVYDRALQVGLRLAGIDFENQKVVELKYKDHYVGEGYPDIIIKIGKEKAVLELKAVPADFGPSEVKQISNYMKILKIPHGLLINFPQPGKGRGKKETKQKPVFQEIP